MFVVGENNILFYGFLQTDIKICLFYYLFIFIMKNFIPSHVPFDYFYIYTKLLSVYRN